LGNRYEDPDRQSSRGNAVLAIRHVTGRGLERKKPTKQAGFQQTS
jgi:hypothetical protein